MFFGDKKVEVRRFEMINSAVSTELDRNYIERISNLGSKLYGLSENDEFIVRIGNSNFISGIVFDIENKINCSIDDIRNNPVYSKRN